MKQAVSWYEKGASQGNPECMEILGCLYFQGEEGVDRDYAKAFEWLNRCEEAGSLQSASKLGYLYMKGLLARADICTRSTSCTVISGYCDSELHIRHTDHRNRLHSFRSISSFFFCQSYRTDNSMRTYICTAVTLDTVVRLPDRNVYRDTTFLVCGRS